MLFCTWKTQSASLQGAPSKAVEDYDYVNLESKAKFDEENEEVKRGLPQDMKRTFDVLVRQSESVPVLPVTDKVSLSVESYILYFSLNQFVNRPFPLSGQ